MKAINDIILKPLISEKSLREASVKHYSFVVAKDASKKQIKDAIDSLFNVNVKKVYTNIIKKNTVRLTRLGKKTQNATFKKARVILDKDQKIDLFEEVTK